MQNASEKRKEYLDERKFLAQLEVDSYKTFDQSLFFVTTGAIALSVTYVTSQDVVGCTGLVLLSWIGWIATVGFQLLSKLKSTEAMAEAQKIITEVYLDDSKDYRTNPYNQNVRFLNALALGTFLLATLIFLIFAYKNVII